MRGGNPPHRRRRGAVRRPAGDNPRPYRRQQARHRGGLPGPRTLRQPRHRRQHVPRPRAGQALAARRGRYGAGGAAHPGVPLRADRDVGADAGRRTVRWPAPDRRDRQVRAVGLEGGPAGRADGGLGRGADPAGARSGAAPRRAGPRRRPHQPQHGRRLRGVRPHRHALPGADGGRGAHQGRHQHPGRRVDHRGPLGRAGPAASGKRNRLMTSMEKTPHPDPAAETAGHGATTGDRSADFGIDTTAKTTGEAIRAYVTKLRGGDLGALPALLGLLALFILFTALASDTFPSLLNLANLLQQGAGQTIIAMGLVFVLLTGEIDLAAGTASGLTAALMALHLVSNGNLLGAMGTTVFVLWAIFLAVTVALGAILRIWSGVVFAALALLLMVVGFPPN